MSVESHCAGLLRRLALNEQVTVDPESVATGVANGSTLGEKTQALVRIAALIAAKSSPASYQWGVNTALARGAGDDEIVDVLLTIAPVVGEARVTSAAPGLASALGYELDP